MIFCREVDPSSLYLGGVAGYVNMKNSSEMEPYVLPDSVQLGRVHLRVADLNRALTFYEDVLGLKATESSPGEALLTTGANGPSLIRLHEDPGLLPHVAQAPGLYHYALLVPDRVSLARVLLRLAERRWPLQGMSDHGVSEAIYLADPDGNGLEIYADRPRDRWPHQAGRLMMGTLPLDVDDLVRGALHHGTGGAGVPAGTCVGHIHLHATSLPHAESFYSAMLGFEVTMRIGSSALFLSAGGYHHHIGLNTWAPMRGGAAAERTAGLLDYEIVLPPGTLRSVVERLRAEGLDPAPVEEGWQVRDPDGISVLLTPAAVHETA